MTKINEELKKIDNKIKTKKELEVIVKQLKLDGKKIIHTNGCFDIIHLGHIITLQKAKELGDILIVSINSDSYIKNVKGANRPIFNEKERAAFLAALNFVDYVTIFSEENILKTLEIIKPDIHVKGGSFVLNKIKKEKKLLKNFGGKFINFPLVNNLSTTSIINRIVKNFLKKGKSK